MATSSIDNMQEYTGGGLTGDEEIESSLPPTTFGGFGTADEYGQAEGSPQGSDALDYLSSLQERAMRAGATSYGQNAAQRWSGTPAIGLSMFKGHAAPNIATTFRNGRPYYSKRSTPGAPLANPPEGLIGGKALENQAKGYDVSGLGASLTPNSDWHKMFPGGGGVGTTSPAGSRPGGPIPRAPVLSRVGGSGGFTPSYAGQTLNPGAFAY